MSISVGATCGFFGKIPARADFIRVGLPRVFIEPWDHWMSGCITGSRAALGQTWLDAWLEAPVWRFALPDGMCGPDAALGLWLPSVDTVGRYFPLMLATLTPRADPASLAGGGIAWLDAAEAVARDALEHDLDPAALAARLPPPPLACVPLPFAVTARPGAGLWWTDGSPRVPKQAMALDTMPDVDTFAMMLDASGAKSEGAA